MKQLPIEEKSYLCKVDFDGVNQEKKIEQPAASSLAADKLDSAPRRHKKNTLDDSVLSVYFTTNDWTLWGNDYNDIAGFANSLLPETQVVVEGHADYRGTENWNKDLGRNRADGVAEVLKRNNTSLDVTTFSYGEARATQEEPDFATMQAERKARIVPHKGVIKWVLDQVPSDVYLIDQSGSMGENISQGRTKWQGVQEYGFVKEAQVYTFSSLDRACGGHVKHEFPNGGTPLLKSLYNLLERMEDGKSLTVLTDGYDTEGGRTPEEILELARKKDVSLSVVGLGVTYSDHKATLRKLAMETGGKFYLPTEG
jgi:outer membrane protein OmpA-like peptidoglycan-associated protein